MEKASKSRFTAMKFKLGDPLDTQLCAALVHEMLRCQEAFQRFSHYAGQNIMGDRSKGTVVKSHNAYADFLRHLYEFYGGCFRRDRRTDDEIKAADLDLLLNAEVSKLLRRKCHSIRQGLGSEWENSISVYELPVPADFAMQFRRLRNENSHASARRVAPAGGMTLLGFYKKYNLFVHLLFESAQSMWGGPHSASSLGEIERFDLASPET